MASKVSKGTTMKYSAAPDYVRDSGKEISRAYEALQAAKKRHEDLTAPSNPRGLGQGIEVR